MYTRHHATADGVRDQISNMQAIADRGARGAPHERPGPRAARAPSYGAIPEACLLVAGLALTLLFAARTMAPAFEPGDVVQDDAREHVYWMARFRNPELFRGDLIADYFQALDPPGYSALYWVLSRVSDPLQVSKLLPPVLGLLTALFAFLLARRLHPAPTGAFLASVLLSWFLWQIDDMASATPRAFLALFLAAQLWALASGRLALAVGLVGLSGLFYPAAAAVGLGLLGVRMLRRRGWRPGLTNERSAWLALAAAAILVVAAQLPTQIASARFGKVASAPEAMTMQEFGPDGRNAYFGRSWYGYWLDSGRSGLDLRVADHEPATISIQLGCLLLAALLPLLARSRRWSAAARLSGQAAILPQLLLASFALFFVAHQVLFHLHYPNRFVRVSLPLVVTVAAGLSLGILIEAMSARVAARLGPRLRGAAGSRTAVAVGLALALGVALILAPAASEGNFRHDRYPLMSQYLRGLPEDTLVAGAPGDLDSVPTFARRRVLASHESALAFHEGYYGEIRRRINDLIEAYYAASPDDVAEFARRYGVDVFLVNRTAFGQRTFPFAWTGLSNGRWEPYTSAVARKLQSGDHFALQSLIRPCGAAEDRELVAIPTECLLRRAQRSQTNAPGSNP
jgi:hypothetical protein